ncbi:MAG TPA: PIN domain-containing protein [Thermoanaerobaculia bacterium]|nr:PIN domain-containing protein [Thermoanaerobaculia bacterium]
MIYLDTHVVAFLYEDAGASLPPLSRSLIAQNDLLLSPMVVLELQYLFEIKRLTVPPGTMIGTIQRAARLRLCDLPFEEVARAGLQETWTRDPFDRIIVAQARLREIILITKDRMIREQYDRATWSRPRSR